MITNHLAVDLYSGDKVVSFKDAYDAGVRLIIHKASEGATVQDHTYSTRRMLARSAGMMWGAYHFLRHSPVDDQIANFLAVAQPDDDMRLVMDWETPDATTEIAKEFLTKLDAKIGRPTILYSYASFLQERLGSTVYTFFGARPLWLAAYRSTPPTPQISWDRYLLWQNTETAHIPGIPGTATGVDASHFDGTGDDLRAAWLSTAAPAPPAAPIAPPAAPAGDPILGAAQAQLADLGYPPGPVDGLDGPKTREAIRKFKINNADLLTILTKGNP